MIKNVNKEIKSPDIRRCSTGQEYNFNSDVWDFQPSTYKVTIDFTEMHEYANTKFIDELKRVIFLSLKKIKPYSYRNMMRTFKQYLKHCYKSNDMVVSNITETSILNYINSCSDNDFRSLKQIMFSLERYDFEYMDKNSYNIIKNIKTITKDYQSVLVADPVKGPLSPSEVSNFLLEIERKFNDDKINLKDYLLTYICFCLALRPKQISLLKVKDYYTSSDVAFGLKHYLNVPRLKQSAYNDRELFKERQLHPNLVIILEEWIKQVKQKYEAIGIDPGDIDEMPIFPRYDTNNDKECVCHCHEDTIGTYIQNIGKKIRVVSDRTYKQINFTANRSRKTIGTRMAINGATAQTIAITLDHSSTRNVYSYVKVATEMASKINDALHDDISPLIQAFKGTIINNTKPIPGTRRVESDITPDHDTGMCIDPRGCGAYSKEGDLESILAEVPFYCYRCDFFNAYSHIETHRYYLQFLIERREIMLRGGSLENDREIENYNASSSLDVTIYAIKNVIQRIEAGEFDE